MPLLSDSYTCRGWRLWLHLTRWVTDHLGSRWNIADNVGTKPDEAVPAQRHTIYDLGAAANIAIFADNAAASDRDAGADQTPCANDYIMMDHGVGQDADVVANHSIAGNDNTRHDQHVATYTRKRRDGCCRMDNGDKAFLRNLKPLNDLASQAIGGWASRHRENVRPQLLQQYISAGDGITIYC